MPTVIQRKSDRNIFDVRNYGAKGDYNVVSNSGTDDSAAFQAAINAAKASANNYYDRPGVVYVPAGHYRVASELTCDQMIVIRGEGRRVSHIWQTTSGNDVLIIDGGATDLDGCEVSGLRLAHRIGGQPAGSAALRIERCVRPILRDLWLTGAETGLQLGDTTDAANTLVQDLQAEAIHVQENTYGVRVGACNQSQWSGCWFNQNLDTQFLVQDAAAVHLSGGLVQGSSTYGVRLLPTTNGSINGVTIEGMHFEVTGVSSVASIAIGDTGKNVTGVSIANNWFSASNVDYGIQSVACYNLDIRANRFNSSGGYEAVNLANTTGTINGLDPTVDNQTIASSCRIVWHDVQRSSTTGARPTMYDVPIGHSIFDTTLGYPIWWNGSVWKDAAGVTR
jgi:hypothetical protein